MRFFPFHSQHPPPPPNILSPRGRLGAYLMGHGLNYDRISFFSSPASLCLVVLPTRPCHEFAEDSFVLDSDGEICKICGGGSDDEVG